MSTGTGAQRAEYTWEYSSVGVEEDERFEIVVANAVVGEGTVVVLNVS